MQNYDYRNAADEYWFCSDGTKRYSLRLSYAGVCMVDSSDLFYFWSPDDSCREGEGFMKKVLNITLCLSFAVTCMEPVTGTTLHKLAAASFLLLSIFHIVLYRRKLSRKCWLLAAVLLASFVSGLFGMIFDTVPLILTAHRVLSIVLIFFLAIHIFIFRKSLII